MEQDFTKRLIIVVRKDLLPWQAANAISHIAAYIGKKLGDTLTTGDSFMSQDGKTYPRNSQYPFIIKSAHSSEQLRTLLEKVREENVLHLAFIREMIDTTSDKEIVALLAGKPDAEIELLGIGVFGPSEEVNTLTKKFGLFS